MASIFILSVAAIVIINSIATMTCLNSKEFSSSQKSSQILLIWLIPLIGAAIIIMFLREDSKPSKPNSQHSVNPSSYGDGEGDGGGE